MLENTDMNNTSNSSDEYSNSAAEYLNRAMAACNEGDAVLGMHLYLTAFEKSLVGVSAPSEDAINGLKQAWSLACTLKERSLAEYIFEKMEPYLNADEISVCAEQLQRLALDKLEEFGLSREELQDMADMISQDFLGIDQVLGVTVGQASPLGSGSIRAGLHGVSAVFPANPEERIPRIQPEEAPGTAPVTDGGDASVASAVLPETPETSLQDEKLLESGKNASLEHAEDSSQSLNEAADDAQAKGGATDVPGAGSAKETSSEGAQKSHLSSIMKAVENQGMKVRENNFSYKDLAGYTNAIRIMRDYGVGMQDDPHFQELISMLNARHGLDRMPSANTLIFRSPAREDATTFMEATAGELKLPIIRMRMEENWQGMPLLSVMAQSDHTPNMSSSQAAFSGRGILMLDDLDLWSVPTHEAPEDRNGFMQLALSRGAREALHFIFSAAKNPDVYVLASAVENSEIDGFFLDMLELSSVINIEYPTSEERVEIWMDIAAHHPSIRGIDRAELVRYSAQMARYDIYMAAREAIEVAYKQSLLSHSYVPVTRENLFDKLAAYQPLESKEYKALEDAVVQDFQRDLEHIDDLLKGE